MRKSIKTKMVLVTAGAALLAAIAADFSRTRAAASGGGGSALAGRQRTWSVTLETRMEEPGVAPGSRAGTTVLTGDWVVTVSNASAAGYDLACELQHAHVAGSGFGDVNAADVERLERKLASRFWISYQPDGAATQVHFPREMGDDVRNFLELLATETQLVRPVQPSPQWTATERDGAGAYFAAYEQLGPGEIVKRRMQYLSVDGAAAPSASSVNVRIQSSETRFTLDAQGLVGEVTGHEVTSLDAKTGSPELGVEIRLHMDHARSTSAPELAGSLERARPDLETGPIVTQRATEDELQARHDARLTKDVTLPVTLQALREGHADDKTGARLESLFRQRASDVRGALAFTRGADPEASKIVLHALGAAGTPEAQEALCALADDASAPVALRTNALGALVQAKRPTESTISELLRLMDSPDSSLRRQATYIAGAAGSNAHDSDPASASRIEGELLGRYAKCGGPGCLDLLAAMGNLATASIVPPVEHALLDPTAEVRASAVRALRKVMDPSADRLISTTMIADRDPNVRAAAVLAATFRPIGPLIEPLSRAAQADPVDYVRSRAIEAVASHVDASPLIEQALFAVATKDPKPGVRRLAREALGPRAAGLAMRAP
jgi:HEAT repeat protein